MNDPFAVARKYLDQYDVDLKASVAAEAPRAWVVQEYRTEGGALAAVKIYSAMLQDNLFLVFEPQQFTAPDGAATYSPDELVALRDKDPATIFKIHHGTKTGKHGGKVLQ